MNRTVPKLATAVKDLSIGFGVFFAFAIFGLVALTGYLVGSSVLEAEKENWKEDLSRQLDFSEVRLTGLIDEALLFAGNSYVTNGIIDVAGRASYLPRELENMTKARGVEFAGVTDFSGKPIALSADFPSSKIDPDQLRYVIETGRSRLWCDVEGRRIFTAVPINYYNTPQGALLLVSNFASINEGLSQNNSGSVEVMCGDKIVDTIGTVTSSAHIDFEVFSDQKTQPLGYMLSMKLRGSVALTHVLEPAIVIVLRLAALGFVFMIVGGFIARRIERELIEARDMALQSSRARSQFLANMSHEIRTPLNGVIGNVNLLLEETLTKEQRSLATDAKTSGMTLLELLNDILDFSKIDAGHMHLEIGVINVRALVDAVDRTYHGALIEKGLTCAAILDDNVPVAISGDALRLRQILNNLFSNAIKFTSSGSVNLRVNIDHVLDSRGEVTAKYIEFAVIDSGIGIPADRIDALFSPFKQAEESTTRRFGGTGLGLSICRELAQLMGGDVKVVSELGVGSQFILRIPLVEVNEVVEEKSQNSGNIIEGVITPMRILLVEDNPVNRTLMSRLLGKYGHQIEIATNGLEAVDLVSAKVFDLIFMDCQMPVMDGYEATKQICAKFPTDRPRIIALTANAFKEDREKCFESGMDDFVTKPVSRESLERIMRSVKKRIA